MKYPLNYLYKIFFFLLIITLISCEKEELTEEPLNSDTTKTIQSEIKISSKPLAQFIEEDAKFKRSYSKFISKRKDIQLKEGSDFEVNPSKVIKVEDSGKTTYTVAITKEDTPIGTFENLVIDVDEDETMQTYILSYIPDANGIVEFTNDSVSFKGTMTVAPIDYDASDLLSQRITVIYITIMFCDVWGTTHLANSGCTGPYPVTFAIPIGSSGSNAASQNNNGIVIVGNQNMPDPNFGGGGSMGGGTTSVPIMGDDENIIKKRDAVIEALKLHPGQKSWVNNNENNEDVKNIFKFLGENFFSNESTDFAKEAVEIMSDSNKLKNPSTPGYLDHLRVYIGDEIPYSYLMHYFSMECAILKLENPSWSDAKVYWEASKAIIHLGLDIAGMAPVVGEVCDLANGLIYAIEGDGVNASLSVAGAIPIAGWFATGAKLAKKGLTVSNGSKTTLRWIVNGSNIIKFGDRGQLRKVLGLATGDGKHAHHIIPWEMAESTIVQKAAKSKDAFHLNEALNGIPLPSADHLIGHNLYNTKVNTVLNQLTSPNMSNELAYNRLKGFASYLDNLIMNNPDKNLGQISELINYVN